MSDVSPDLCWTRVQNDEFILWKVYNFGIDTGSIESVYVPSSQTSQSQITSCPCPSCL